MSAPSCWVKNESDQIVKSLRRQLAEDIVQLNTG